ncbi:hypothetical protein POL68_39330 [Stigmatella sp. ncwal1]|uniref:Uncharacterized protein n=1 Tax=Stigmatella ashevillensis TaxID=2995309 RepID=A0ABT5DLM3_9BACT|nr:hypothetical protein [Stigmatella ashevillena]MDC0714567.1 hypothetical protein [Stigmatella ashevillena]
MIIRNDRPVSRPSVTSPVASQEATPQASPSAPPPTARPFQQDTFAQGTQALQRTAQVAAAPPGDHGALMREYLTGARPPPADFEQVMGYKPYTIQTEHGPRAQDPFGSASAPGKIGPDMEFDPAAKTHDYGYDMLRYYAKKGTPLAPEARKAADQLFREDLFDYANDQQGWGDRTKFKAWAQIYATAVELNSRVQNYGPP